MTILLFAAALAGACAHPSPPSDAPKSVDAFGPLHFGDPPELAAERLRQHPAANCLDDSCGRVEFEVDGSSVVLLSDFKDGGLTYVVGLAKPTAKNEDHEAIRDNWRTLVAWAQREFGPADSELAALPPLEGLTETVETHSWESEGRIVKVGVRYQEGSRWSPVALMLIARSQDPVREPVPASPSP